MRVFILITIFSFLYPLELFGDECSREKVCALSKKMNPFAVLDKCPSSALILRGCKNFGSKKIQYLLSQPKLINKGSIVIDSANNLVWSKKEFSSKQFSFKDAKKVAIQADFSGISNWRLPTLSELVSLMGLDRSLNDSGKRSYINPIFNDGPGWNDYWTTTTCEEVTTYTGKRYGTKNCQEGESAVWFVNFKLGTISWSFKTSTHWIWLVSNWNGK